MKRSWLCLFTERKEGNVRWDEKVFLVVETTTRNELVNFVDDSSNR